MHQQTPLLTTIRNILTRISPADVLFSILIFGSILCTAEIGYVVSETENISQIILWAPSGIAFAAALMRRQRSFLPIALAFVTAGILSQPLDPISHTLLIAAAQTVSPLVGAFFLHRRNFSGSFNTLSETLSFIGVAFAVAGADTALSSLTQIAGGLSAETLTFVLMSWAGKLLSILVITPVILTWLSWRGSTLLTARREQIEAASVLAVILVLSYFIFWRTLSLPFSFGLILVLLVTLFWVAIRLSIQKIAVALLVLTVFSFIGVFVSSHGISSILPQRIIALELLIILTAPIFLSIATLERERRRTSQALSEQAQLLDDAMIKLRSEDEIKNEFLAILAHELRNPLATILNTIELVEDQKANSKEIPLLLSIVEQEVRSMASLLDDLLNVSRITRNKFQLNKEKVPLAPLLEKAMTTIEAITASKSRELTVARPLPDIILEADPMRLEQIIVNVINNAIKYSDSHGTIELSAQEEGSHVLIKTIVHGGGIPQYILALIFEPFFRINQSSTESSSLGIGLARTRQLVELHGGTIEARQQQNGNGSEFIVRLPIIQDPTARTRPSIKVQKIELPQAVHVAEGNLKILVVDDNDVAANALGQLLALRGYNIAIAYNAAQAFEQALKFRPHVAILDIGMPDLDGYEIVGLLREEKLNCSYVALTGYGQIHDKKKALAAGFDYHLTKPTGLKEIETILKKVEKEIAKQQAIATDQTTLPFLDDERMPS